MDEQAELMGAGGIIININISVLRVPHPLFSCLPFLSSWAGAELISSFGLIKISKNFNSRSQINSIREQVQILKNSLMCKIL